jgi:hypothetical protein
MVIMYSFIRSIKTSSYDCNHIKIDNYQLSYLFYRYEQR